MHLRRHTLAEALLYRGDGEHIERFDVLKTDSSALFGAGIYLTTDPDVAHDYTVSRRDHRVFPVDRHDPESRSVRALIRNYVQRLADTFDERAFKDEWVRRNGHGDRYNGLPSSAHDQMNRDMQEAKRQSARTRWPDAVARVRRELPNLRVLRKTTGELVLVRPDRTAAVSVFDIPDSYLARTLHADRPLPDAALDGIKALWRAFYGQGNDGDLRDGDENRVDFDGYVRNYRERGTRYAWREKHNDNEWWRGGKGENPTLDDLINGTHAGHYVFKDGMFDAEKPRLAAVREAMRRMGYVGLEYDGGKSVSGHVRGGGGRHHRAFVFWFPDEIARFRLPNAPIPPGDLPSPRAMPPKDPYAPRHAARKPT